MSKILLIKPERKKEKVPSIIVDLHRIIRHLGREYMKIFIEKEGGEIEPKWFYSIEGKTPISLGLLSIGSYLLSHGFSKKEITYTHLSFEDIKTSNIKKYGNYDIIGITANTPDIPLVLKISQKIKQINRNSLIVIGGSHATFEYKSLLSFPFIDIVVRGEGEETFREIIEVYEKGKGEFSSIKGIAFRENNKIKVTQERKFLPPEKIPKIEFRKFFRKKEVKKYLFYTMSSRGCFYNCLFCAESKIWGHPRIRKYEDVRDEIKEISYLTSSKFVHLADSIFPINVDHINKFKDLSSEWDGVLSVNIHVPLLLRQKKAYEMFKNLNILEAFIGIESCSDEVLRRNYKPFSFKDIYLLLKKLKKAKIFLRRGYIIVGLPGETRKTFEENYKRLEFLFSQNLLFDIIPRIFVPYPGLAVYENHKKFGIINLRKNWEEYARWYFPPPFKYKNLSPVKLLEFLIRLYLLQINKMIELVGNEEILSRFNLSLLFP